MSQPAGRRTNPLAVVALLLVAMAAYFVLIGIRGVFLLDQSRLSLKVLGVAVLLLPLVGIWVVIAELRFGAASERLARQLLDEGAPVAVPELPRSPSGRIERRAADGWFAEQQVIVEADPDNWRGWFRLAQAYDVAGDRKRGRAALRTAIALRAGTRTPPDEHNVDGCKPDAG